MYFFMEEVREAAKKIGLKYALSHGILDFMQDGLKQTEKLANHLNPSEFVVGPHSIYTCSEETLLRAKELATKYNTKLHIWTHIVY